MVSSWPFLIFRYGGIGFKDHPTGSNLVGWTKTAYNSPIAYLQFGQDHVGYENPVFATLVNNAIRWGVAELSQRVRGEVV